MLECLECSLQLFSASPLPLLVDPVPSVNKLLQLIVHPWTVKFYTCCLVRYVLCYLISQAILPCCLDLFYARVFCIHAQRMEAMSSAETVLYCPSQIICSRQYVKLHRLWQGWAAVQHEQSHGQLSQERSQPKVSCWDSWCSLPAPRSTLFPDFIGAVCVFVCLKKRKFIKILYIVLQCLIKKKKKKTFLYNLLCYVVLLG